MNTGILESVGGVGLFLLGMLTMTDSLRRLAGRTLRRVLRRFTRSPWTGAATGAAMTASVQSSSATTVAAVGFVGAGLMTFPQALGVIFGANLGTTITGWLVAIFGFKLDIGALALLLVFVGVVLRLFGSKRLAMIGTASAGFGLVFVGIDVLQEGVAGLPDQITPESFPADDLRGRLLLVLLGIVVTVVTQSSSAGVAMAMTAVHAGALQFGQAAAMVIGMDIGTTVTAAVATVGGSVDAKRTGYAHVVYNVMTAVGAFFLLPVFMFVCNAVRADFLSHDPEIGIVAFHSLFNVLGVVAILPFTERFAQWMVRIVPSVEEPLTRRLHRAALQDPAGAQAAIGETLQGITVEVLGVLRQILCGNGPLADDRAERLQKSLYETRSFLQRRREVGNPHEGEYDFDEAAIQLMDHLGRVIHRCQRGGHLFDAPEDPQLLRDRDVFAIELEKLENATLRGEATGEHETALEDLWRRFDRDGHAHRKRVIQNRASQLEAIEEALDQISAIRWLTRNTHHAFRIAHHLQALRE